MRAIASSRRALHQGEAFACSAALEIEFAPHGARGDRGDAVRRRPPSAPSSSMHSWPIMVESMSAMSRRLRRLCGGNDGYDRSDDRRRGRRGRLRSRSRRRRKFACASPCSSHSLARPPVRRARSPRPRTDCARARGCYEDENGVHLDACRKTRGAYRRADGQRQVGAGARARAGRDGVIINADAMQVYRELRILTARPSRPKMRLRCRTASTAMSPAAEAYSVARWLDDARREIDAAWARACVPVITGGTGLYFKALEQGLADIPAHPGATSRANGATRRAISMPNSRSATRQPPAASIPMIASASSGRSRSSRRQAGRSILAAHRPERGGPVGRRMRAHLAQSGPAGPL